MPVDMSCPHCGTGLSFPDEAAGTPSWCPNCGNTVQVEGSASKQPEKQPVKSAAPEAKKAGLRGMLSRFFK